MLQIDRSRTGRRVAAVLGLSLLGAACGGSSGPGPGPGPVTPPGTDLEALADLGDGTPWGVATSGELVWLAQGRRLAVLDGQTLERREELEKTFTAPLAGVQHDEAQDRLLVTTNGGFSLYSPANAAAPVKSWSVPDADADGDPDLHLFDGRLVGDAVVLVAEDRAVVVDLGGQQPAVVSEALLPAPFLLGKHVVPYQATDGSWRAAVVASLEIDQRQVNGFVLLDLDSANGWLAPEFGGAWIPNRITQPFATVLGLVVARDPDTGHAFAYVAAGGSATEPFMPVFDVEDPSPPEPPAVDRIDLTALLPGNPANRTAVAVTVSPTGTHLLVATDVSVQKVDLAERVVIGVTAAPFPKIYDGGMAAGSLAGTEVLWSFLGGNSSFYPLRSFDVTADTPVALELGWWWVAMDAAVTVPEWKSVYLTTWSGLARYDATDPESPLVPGGHFVGPESSAFQPGTAVTEEAVLYAGARSFIVVARGAGGFDAFEVSAAEPNPAPPITLEYDGTLGLHLYNNDVQVWKADDGVTYVLADETTLVQGAARFVLLAARFDETLGAFEWVAESALQIPDPAVSQPLTTRIDVIGQHAFVGCRGMLFVVDLAGLPDELVVTDVRDLVDLDGNWDTAKGTLGLGIHRIVGSTGSKPLRSKLRVWDFDATTGKLSAVPLELASGHPSLPADFEVSSALARSSAGDRLFVCGNGGRLFSFDITDPLEPELVSIWGEDSLGLTTDCSTAKFKMPDGTEKELVVLTVQSQEFKLLDPYAD